jgi:hypothetical protein
MPFVNAQVTNCVLYPIHLPVAYETDSRNRPGQGRTVALGGRIVRFSTDQNLRVGQKMRMELSWPAPLDDGTNLNLWMFGTVVRSAHVEVEVRITAYEFRFSAPAPMIRRSHPQPIRPHSPLMTLANIGASGSKARQEGESFCASRSLQSPPPTSSLRAAPDKSSLPVRRLACRPAETSIYSRLNSGKAKDVFAP